MITDQRPRRALPRPVVIRKGGARDVIVWQTGTARLVPRLLTGRKTGPVFLTDRKARPSLALCVVHPTTKRAWLSYRADRRRRLEELFAGVLPPLQLVPATSDQEEALQCLRIESVIRAMS